MATATKVPLEELGKRSVPEAVTLPGALVLEVLSTLHGVESAFEWLAGNVSPAAASKTCGGLAERVERQAFGEIPGHHDDAYGDEPWQTDPIINEWWPRGFEIAADIIEAMANDDPADLGLGIIYDLDLISGSRAASTCQLERHVEKLRAYAQNIRNGEK